MATEKKSPVQALVLDAHPLITQHFNTLSTYASSFHTSASVFREIKDENARRNLDLWKDQLNVRHPKQEYIKKVSDFAKLTGDYNVLSAPDIHIIALTYELEVELNGGSDEHLRRYPGEKKNKKQTEEGDEKEKKKMREEEGESKKDDDWSTVPSKKAAKPQQVKPEQAQEAGSEEKVALQAAEQKKKPRRRGGKKQRAKREAAVGQEAEQKQAEAGEVEHEQDDSNTIAFGDIKIEVSDENNISEQLEKLDPNQPPSDTIDELLREVPTTVGTQQETNENEDHEGVDDDDDGEWITSENLSDTIRKDTGEQVEETALNTKVALSSQDFAVQNVAIQIGLKLINVATGLQIKKIRNYMLRCHACFKLQPVTESESKHFCAFCGGNTVLRCTVVVDAKTGEMKPLLKRNFEWHNKGNRYSLPSPLSKNTQKKLGKGGYQHNKQSKNYAAYHDIPILRADQKEYSKAIKNEQWTQKQNDKLLESWIGGGSADNFYSPFANGDSSSRYHSNVRVNPGRYANAPRRR